MRNSTAFLGFIALSLSRLSQLLGAEAAAVKDVLAVPSTWTSVISAEVLLGRLKEARPILVDVRSAAEYAKGHIPGAINFPAELWRTPGAKPGEGKSQYIFRLADESPDVPKYETLLGGAGLTREDEVVIYGSHGGKSDGSVPAMLLNWLGQERVAFLDGIGIEQWAKAGGSLSREAYVLPPATYSARPIPRFIWNLDDVLAHLHADDVVFLDTRTPEEFAGLDRVNNKRAGHIPGAVACNYTDFLRKEDKTAISPQEAANRLRARGVTPDKTVVLYCQTATRVSLPALLLKDLGYPNVVIYDASWFEYGNLDSTPIEAGALQAGAAAE